MIRNVTVYIDNNPGEIENTFRCGFIVTENIDGEENYFNDLIDQSEYYLLRDLVSDIAGILKVRKRDIMVNA
ncbi:MAG: hypothetical protein KJ950_15680 [Proteobacteria bacterium]|nr:hypothetical protein [Pseudomonadota bacterium]